MGLASAARTAGCWAGEGARQRCWHSPTKLCVLLSQSGAARTPLATSATKAFLICRWSGKWVRGSPSPLPPLPVLADPPLGHLQGDVEDDELAAGGDGIVAAVAPHEVHVDLGVRALQLALRAWAQPQHLIAQREGDGSPAPPPVLFLLLPLLPGARGLREPCGQTHPSPGW